MIFPSKVLINIYPKKSSSVGLLPRHTLPPVKIIILTKKANKLNLNLKLKKEQDKTKKADYLLGWEQWVRAYVSSPDLRKDETPRSTPLIIRTSDISLTS